MVLSGQEIKLRPMTEADKQLFFEMATKSEATPYLYGEMYGTKVPSWDELFDDYKDFYFDGSRPEKGRCFAILLKERIIGQVNYNEIGREQSSVELDIWIANEDDTSKGAGTDTLQTLIKYLHEKMNVNNFFICPSANNPRAIKSYQNAGFNIVKKYLDDQGKEIYRMEKRI